MHVWCVYSAECSALSSAHADAMHSIVAAIIWIHICQWLQALHRSGVFCRIGCLLVEEIFLSQAVDFEEIHAEGIAINTDKQPRRSLALRIFTCQPKFCFASMPQGLVLASDDSWRNLTWLLHVSLLCLERKLEKN